ncbi:hypothetical protein F5890DRAFT_1558431 [Lentinula detonsa]|uniref:Uncharacterized protein n=1 Tax=Lentinula detonsa TaxID=2804962 RepID=A0AA38UN01_9AGAR|nr:hypothetical protein F5890DRAFT_1558431 [Lentinula detonsa]
MSQQHDTQPNPTDDQSRSTAIQFGDFHESPNTQNAPLGATSTAGTPAFNNVTGPGFPGPFGGGSQLPPNQHVLFGAPMNTGMPVFHNTPSTGFQGQSGGGSHTGPNFGNANSQFGTPGAGPNFSSPFTGQNSYASASANYPYQSLHPPTHMQQSFPTQMQNPIASYGYPMPMMAPQGQSTASPSSTSLRITVGNIITHSDNCPMCMGYVAHLITASDFNNIISERDGNIRGDSLSSTNSQGRELVNLQDRITALELECNELRARHESDVAQIDDIVRDCQEAHDRRQYWKAQYYDLRDQGDRQDAKTSSKVAVAKKLDKGKGKEVANIPLQDRIATMGAQRPTRTSLPLSQRLSPVEGDSNSQSIPENARASGSGQHRMSGQAGTSLLGGSVSTPLTPHTGDKRKRDSVPTSVPQRGTVSYDDLYTEPTGEVQYSYKAYQVEHYLTDMEDDDSEPEEHPNRLKGKQREIQNKINREARRRMDAASAQRAKEEGRSPPPKRSKSSKNKEFDVLRGMVTKLPFQDPTSVEEVEKIIKTLEESDNVRPWRPLWKTVHGMIAMHKRARHVPRAERSAVDNAVIDRFTAVPQWYAAEMTRQGHTVPKLFEPKPLQKKARHTTAGASLYEAGPSNIASTSAMTDGETMAAVPTIANGTIVERSPTVLERRVWQGRRENDSVLQWADSILSSPASDRLNGMLVESIQDSPTTNTRSIRGMLAVFRLLPNNTGNGLLTEGESNLLVHLFLCELALHPNCYDGILQSMGLLPHRTFRPGPLPDYSRASPPTVRQIAHKLAIRGYTTAQLQDLALYLLWWLYKVASSMTTRWVVIQQQFVHVVNDVLAHYVFQGVPRTTIEVENYVFTDGSQSGNLGNAGRFADYSVVLTHVRPIAQQLSLPVMGQPATPITTDDVHLDGEAPSIVDWDDTQFNAEGDPVIDYGEDDGMNMAG